MNRADHALEILLFLRELLASGGGQRVIPRAPIVLRLPPFGFHEAVEEESLECGVERALAHLEHVLRDLAQSLGDGVSMQGLVTQGAEDQEIERAG